jgi:hypothetical protein
MNPRATKSPGLTIDEVRAVADLRIMHAKVAELFQICESLQERYDESEIIAYSDKKLLSEDINKVDTLYLWYVKLKEEAEHRQRRRVNGE